ncbi:M3 family metallopeptidase [Mycoplasma marinum]|uniref:Peptidase M3A/M3B catalytic domain-containing protein n=1 Tax=Mycoplasma marinum TaxID=1937190 RepID=A0A4R0XVN3_9MOLU|nr:M3 family metallopeptidase [Mycoplasma marinum]TCG11923.1 hypothetical protein C4B24_00810 [Mycoplasma marinum]
MIEPVLVADVKLSYKNKKEYESDLVILREAYKEFSKKDFLPINKLNLIDFNESLNLIRGKMEYLFTYLFVQFHSDTRKTEIMDEAQELLDLSDSLGIKVDTFTDKLVEFGKEKTMAIIEECEELKIWKETFSQLLRSQVKSLNKDETKEKEKREKEFTKMSIEAEKLGNKPLVHHFEHEGKKYTDDESNVLALNPNTSRDLRKKIFMHNTLDKRENREEIETMIAEYANKRIEYLKMFGYSSYDQFVGISRDEEPLFAKNIMLSSKELFKEIHSKYISRLNDYRKQKFGWDTIMPWDELSYPSEIVDIPYQEIINFYQNEIKDIFPKESQYIIDNFSKKGTLAIIESEHKYNGAAATWTGKNNTYYVTQSYVASIPYSASTLAHEIGHTMHIVAAKLNKQVEEARFSLAIGEGIADTFSMLFAFASMDKGAPYAKTIAYEALARLMQVTSAFSYNTLAEDALYVKGWKGEEILKEDIAKFAYDFRMQFRPDGNPIIVDGENITKKLSTMRYFSVGSHYTFSSYTISFIMAIYLADQIRKGDTSTFIKILNMGAEEYSTNHILEMVNIDITSKEVKDVVLKTVEEITEYIINK